MLSTTHCNVGSRGNALIVGDIDRGIYGRRGVCAYSTVRILVYYMCGGVGCACGVWSAERGEASTGLSTLNSCVAMFPLRVRREQLAARIPPKKIVLWTLLFVGMRMHTPHDSVRPSAHTGVQVFPLR